MPAVICSALASRTTAIRFRANELNIPILIILYLLIETFLILDLALDVLGLSAISR
ncbi:hypothetical protein M1M97_04145 [Thermodesulfovibrionales bacterium]|nr:hypothetical protein [Thermodesulfovibrionales bacterium]